MKYTIEDLRNGKVAVINDGSLRQLTVVLSLAFPKDETDLEAFLHFKFFYRWEYFTSGWSYSNEISDSLPTQSVKDFLVHNDTKGISDETITKLLLKNRIKDIYRNDKDQLVVRTESDKELIVCLEKPKSLKTESNSCATQNKPPHYSKGIDTFARMESNCTKEECLAFTKGCLDKYVWRTKGQDKEDFEKIIAYAQWAIKIMDNHAK